jgi:hypothetical protein
VRSAARYENPIKGNLIGIWWKAVDWNQTALWSKATKFPGSMKEGKFLEGREVPLRKGSSIKEGKFLDGREVP